VQPALDSQSAENCRSEREEVEKYIKVLRKVWSHI